MNFYLTTTAFSNSKRNSEHLVALIEYCIDSFNENVRDKGFGEIKGIFTPQRLSPKLKSATYRDIPVTMIKTHLEKGEDGYEESVEVTKDVWIKKSTFRAIPILNFKDNKRRSRYNGDNEHHILFNGMQNHLEYPCIVMDSDVIIHDIPDDFESHFKDEVLMDSSWMVYLPTKEHNRDVLYGHRRLGRRQDILNTTNINYHHIGTKTAFKILDGRTFEENQCPLFIQERFKEYLNNIRESN